MKYTPKFEGKVGGTIDNPKLELENRKLFVKQLQSLFGKRFSLEIKKWTKPRSLNQNAFWHGVWLPILAEEERKNGNIHLTDDQICFYWRQKCPVACESVRISNNSYTYIRSTASLNSDEMSDFLMFVQAEAAKDGIELPPASKEEAAERSLEIAEELKKVDGFKGRRFSAEK